MFVLRGIGNVGLAGVPTLAGSYLAFLGICVVIGLVALVLTCALPRTDAGPVSLAVLRLAGTFAIVSIVPPLFGSLGLFGLLFAGALMAMLVAWLFELDITEAMIVSVIIWILWVGAFLALATLIT